VLICLYFTKKQSKEREGNVENDMEIEVRGYRGILVYLEAIDGKEIGEETAYNIQINLREKEIIVLNMVSTREIKDMTIIVEE